MSHSKTIAVGMSTHLIVAVLISFVLAVPVKSSEDVAQDVAELEKLIAEVTKAVPPGWNVEFDVADLYLGGMRPVLKVTSAKELPVEYLGPGMPPPPPHIQHEKVTVWLAFMMRLTPQEYQAARKRNEMLASKRRQFIEEHIKNVPFGGKGEDPAPPFAFRPRSAAEGTLVRQYAFLWLATEPANLPNHYYGGLSLWYWPGTIKIHVDRGQKEYSQIIDALNEIISPYEDDKTH